MSLINVVNLTFAYEGSYDTIFENVSFQLDTDWKLGFTGRNGRGKTTFLQLLMGKYEYRGTIAAAVQFDYFPFAVTNRNDSVRQVIGAINPGAQDWEVEKELSLLAVCDDVLERDFSTLSHGEQTKVLLAALFLKDNHFLLIDEPTNHLDMEARQVVSAYLNKKRGYILVSHDRAFLDQCIDHILVINKTNIEVQKGNFSSWWYNRELHEQFEMAENEKLQKEIVKLTDAARRTANWSDKVEKTKKGTLNSGIKPDKGYIGHKAAKMMKRSKALEVRRQKDIEEKEKLLKNVETAESLALKPAVYAKDILASASSLSVYYGEKEVCTDVSFTIRRGDRIVLSGRNGSGKSSLLKLLRGDAISYTGNLQVGSNLKISYVPQDTSHLRGGLREFAEANAIDESLFKTILRKLDFARVQFEKDIAAFSAGQKKKVVLAQSLCEQAHLYIWDEPLNYIDVLSRIQIEELILNYKPTMILVEHDWTFAEAVATKWIRL